MRGVNKNLIIVLVAIVIVVLGVLYSFGTFGFIASNLNKLYAPSGLVTYDNGNTGGSPLYTCENGQRVPSSSDCPNVLAQLTCDDVVSKFEESLVLRSNLEFIEKGIISLGDNYPEIVSILEQLKDETKMNLQDINNEIANRAPSECFESEKDKLLELAGLYSSDSKNF